MVLDGQIGQNDSGGEKKEMIIINWVHWDDGILSGKMQYSDDRLCRAIKFS